MTGALDAVAKATDKPGDEVHAVPVLDPEESQNVEADTEGCERCASRPVPGWPRWRS